MSLSKKNNLILLILGLIIIGGFSVYKYAYKPHKTIDELDVKFSGTSEAFLEKVKTDAGTWQDVVVQLTGNITAIDDKGITLNNIIYCQFEKKMSISTLREKQDVTIKGRMIGFDDLLEEIKLDQTTIK